MLAALASIWNACQALSEEVMEFVSWRGDWNRTWSPASYFLALISALLAVILVVLYGADAWNYLQDGLLS